MLSHLLPRQADNDYRGQKVALWILGLVTLLNGVIGFNSNLNTRQIATTADGIPLDTFPAAATQTILSLFAMLGVGRLVMFALCVVVLVRYRALVPLMLSVLLLGQVLSQLTQYFTPLPRVGNPPASFIIPGILAVTALGLILSLWQRNVSTVR